MHTGGGARDIDTLKDYGNDDDEIGSAVINAADQGSLPRIREADVDGFRVDAVKHMNAVACSRFLLEYSEYAYSLANAGSSCSERCES